MLIKKGLIAVTPKSIERMIKNDYLKNNDRGDRFQFGK
jgi:hypothetical protein